MFFWSVNGKSQTQLIDSLEAGLKVATSDSMRFNNYIILAKDYFNYDTLKSKEYLKEARRLADKVRSDYVYGDFYLNWAIIKQYSSEHERAYLLLDSAIYFYRKSISDKPPSNVLDNATISIATAEGQQGDIFFQQGKNKEAIARYMSSLDVWEHSNDTRKDIAVAIFYSKISTVHYTIGEFDKALEYDKKALALHRKRNNEENIAFGLIYITDDYISLKKLDSALLYLEEADPIVKKLNNHRINIQYYNKLAFIARQKEEYQKAISYFEKTLEEARITNNNYQIMTTNKSIGYCYHSMKDYRSAKKYFLLALSQAESQKSVKHEVDILDEFVKVEEKLNNNAQAYVYLKRLSHLKDSLNAQKTKEEIAEIENKYQAAEKEKKIVELEASTKIKSLSLKQKSTLNYILIASLGGFLVFTFLGIRNFRHRQVLARQQDELQQQRIRELEKDRQLIAVDSMLKGQEEERSRLAKDLHDGLGGMLSGVKFSLMNMKSNLIVDHENVVVFERSLDMLDTSIRELRRVAHNMMPEALVKFGLDEALKDYCNNINQSNVLNIKYQSFGITRMEKTTEIILYRVIQELLNNVFKHAKASEVLVQVMQEGSHVSITVEDNGIGMDPSIIETTKGAGWANIKNRVDYLKGKLDVHSEPGKGTSINIEINV